MAAFPDRFSGVTWRAADDRFAAFDIVVKRRAQPVEAVCSRRACRLAPAFCFVHARRGFFELPDIEKNAREGQKVKPISPIALEAVRRLDTLFEIERAINGLAGRTPTAKLVGLSIRPNVSPTWMVTAALSAAKPVNDMAVSFRKQKFTMEPQAFICIRRVGKGLMRLWVVILVSFLVAPLLLWRSAAHTPVTRMERVQWLSHAQEKLLEEQ